jgi:hypothetical protein
MKIINCTPHVINVVNQDGTTANLNPSGTVPRVSVDRTFLKKSVGCDIFRPDFGAVVDAPARVKDTFYIVSALVASASPDRDDYLTPGNPVRDDKGVIIGCNGLNCPNL